MSHAEPLYNDINDSEWIVIRYDRVSYKRVSGGVLILIRRLLYSSFEYSRIAGLEIISIKFSAAHFP